MATQANPFAVNTTTTKPYAPATLQTNPAIKTSQTMQQPQGLTPPPAVKQTGFGTAQPQQFQPQPQQFQPQPQPQQFQPQLQLQPQQFQSQLQPQQFQSQLQPQQFQPQLQPQQFQSQLQPQQFQSQSMQQAYNAGNYAPRNAEEAAQLDMAKQQAYNAGNYAPRNAEEAAQLDMAKQKAALMQPPPQPPEQQQKPDFNYHMQALSKNLGFPPHVAQKFAGDIINNQNLADSLYKIYGTNTTAMQQDPRFNLLQQESKQLSFNLQNARAMYSRNMPAQPQNPMPQQNNVNQMLWNQQAAQPRIK